MSVAQWMVKTAEYMAKERPDIYSDADTAMSDLSRIYDTLSEVDGPSWSSWGGFFLHKWEEDGLIEWTLMRKISTVDVDTEEAGSQTYRWSDAVDLPDISL